MTSSSRELLLLIGAGVPDRHRAGAVLALRDGALERAVLERVVLGVHGQVVLPRIGRHVLGDGPAHQHPVALEAEVEVHAAGRVVLLDDERVARALLLARAPLPIGSGVLEASRIER